MIRSVLSDATSPGAYYAALAALRRGEVVVVCPEETFTDDPDGWKMRGKTGVARLALATGMPVTHWGGQHVLPRRRSVPRLLPERTVRTHRSAQTDARARTDVLITAVPQRPTPTSAATGPSERSAHDALHELGPITLADPDIVAAHITRVTLIGRSNSGTS